MVGRGVHTVGTANAPSGGAAPTFDFGTAGMAKSAPAAAPAAAGDGDDGSGDDEAPSSPTLAPAAAAGEDEKLEFDEKAKVMRFDVENKEWTDCGTGLMRLYNNSTEKRFVLQVDC